MISIHECVCNACLLFALRLEAIYKSLMLNVRDGSFSDATVFQVNALDRHSDTPLSWAARSGHLDAVPWSAFQST